MLSHDSSDFDLTIRQQPERARVAGGKEKGMSLMRLLCLFPSDLMLSSARSGAGESWSRVRRPEEVRVVELTGSFSYRAQTHRSAADRPAQGARGGFVSGAVSFAVFRVVLHRGRLCC